MSTGGKRLGIAMQLAHEMRRGLQVVIGIGRIDCDTDRRRGVDIVPLDHAGFADVLLHQLSLAGTGPRRLGGLNHCSPASAALRLQA